MKILYCHRTKSADGQYVHIEALTRSLAAASHEVLIWGPDGIERPNEPRKALTAGNNAAPEKASPLRQRLPFGLYEWAELAYSVPAYRQLLKAAKSFAPDIIYERYNLYFHAGAWLADHLKIPRILEVNAPLAQERAKHGALALKRVAARSERNLWRGANAVLPVTSVLGQMIIAQGVDESNIHVLPNGVDERTFDLQKGHIIRERYELDEKLVLGFVGFVRDWHGVDHALNWLASPMGHSAHILLVGDGPAVPALKEQAARLGIEKRFTVTGVVQRDEIACHIAAFDIALQPAVTAYASPLKLQEYMAQARAIIAPDQDNIRETVTHQKDAFLIQTQNENALSDALDLLSIDEALRLRLGAAARQTLINRNMTWDANAARVGQIAKQLLES